VGDKNPGKRYELVSLIIKKGARADTVDESGRSPLHYAINNHSLKSDMLQLLIEAGADVNAHDRNGISPLTQVYRKKARLEQLYKKEFDFTKTIKVLVDAGAKE